MEQYVMKTGGKFILNDSIDPNNAYHVNSIKEFDSLRKISSGESAILKAYRCLKSISKRFESGP